MLVDTHCHLNMIVKKEFDVLMNKQEYEAAYKFVEEAKNETVNLIINVGTSVIESINCVTLAKSYNEIYAAVGIHPNDLKENWKDEIKEIEKLIKEKQANKIVAIGECGIDLYRPGYDFQRQKDAFKYHIELSLENNLALIVHSRSAPAETLRSLDEFHKELENNCVIHCFSESLEFANQIIDWGFYLGIGGTITYPKNNQMRDIIKKIKLSNIVLETDAPFLPPQIIRGKQNEPKYIKYIADYISKLLEVDFDAVCAKTTDNALKLFNL